MLALSLIHIYIEDHGLGEAGEAAVSVLKGGERLLEEEDLPPAGLDAQVDEGPLLHLGRPLLRLQAEDGLCQVKTGADPFQEIPDQELRPVVLGHLAIPEGGEDQDVGAALIAERCV